MKNKEGVSLIILIVVIAILCVAICMLFFNIKNKQVVNDTKTKVEENVKKIKDEYDKYIASKETEYQNQGLVYEKEKLNANELVATYNDENIGTIKNILPSISQVRYDSAFEIKNGVLTLTNNYDFSDEEKELINNILNKKYNIYI